MVITSVATAIFCSDGGRDLNQSTVMAASNCCIGQSNDELVHLQGQPADLQMDGIHLSTRAESISSYSDEGSSTLSFTSTTSPIDRIFEYPINFPRMIELTLDHTPEVPSPSQPSYSSNPKVSNLLPYERNDLDYEIFEIDDPHHHNWNRVELPSPGDHIRRIIPNKIARTLVECPVWAATGTTGCVQGIMMRQPHYIKMEGSETFQEMWVLKLDRNTSKSSESPQRAFWLIFPLVDPGDSGAWVVDSAGQLYGHIVAGDPMLGLAFIIPAYRIFEDIKSRFGEEPLLCHSSSVIQPYNALNDNENAEQPLIDSIKGKGTGTMILLDGLPRFDKTVKAELIAAYAHRALYSIGYRDLGTDNTKIEKNITIILYCGQKWACILIQKTDVYFIPNLDVANWTRLKKAEQYLQTVVQEVLHGRTALFSGNLSGTSMTMTGTSNQLMAANFSGLEFSAIPSSFSSIVPSIGAYTYISCNQGKTNDAAASRVCALHNGVMVWKFSPRKA